MRTLLITLGFVAFAGAASAQESATHEPAATAEDQTGRYQLHSGPHLDRLLMIDTATGLIWALDPDGWNMLPATPGTPASQAKANFYFMKTVCQGFKDGGPPFDTRMIFNCLRYGIELAEDD